MKTYHLFAVLLATLIVGLTSGCASSTAKRYKNTPYSSIESWTLKLAYETVATSETSPNDKTTLTTRTRIGNSENINSRIELRFREELFFYLKDRDLINIKEEGDGSILVSIDDEIPSQMIKLVTVKLTDKKGEVLSRIKIKNSDFTSENFLRLVGDSICSEINSDK